MPVDFVSAIVVLVSTLISVSLLGLVAGFSPTLYVTQIAVTSKVKRPLAYAASLMGGVLVAVLVLILLFQVIQLDTLLQIINDSVRALTLSVAFNMLIGVGFVWAGAWYLHDKNVLKAPKAPKTKHASGLVSVFTLGFARTFISVSGVTATFFAGNIISNISVSIIEQLIFTLVFFAAAIVPFIGIILYMRSNPKRILQATDELRALLGRINYRPIVGTGALILGSAIIVFNLMIALLY